jgi:hypothetical protein
MRNAMDSQEVAVGWWPGDRRYGRAAFYAYAHPAEPGFAGAQLSSELGAWNDALGEYVLDWADVSAAPDPHASALESAHAALRHGCKACGWAHGAAGQPRHTARRLSARPACARCRQRIRRRLDRGEQRLSRRSGRVGGRRRRRSRN